jgi:hypothetical protein
MWKGHFWNRTFGKEKKRLKKSVKQVCIFVSQCESSESLCVRVLCFYRDQWLTWIIADTQIAEWNGIIPSYSKLCPDCSKNLVSCIYQFQGKTLANRKRLCNKTGDWINENLKKSIESPYGEQLGWIDTMVNELMTPLICLITFRWPWSLRRICGQ